MVAIFLIDHCIMIHKLLLGWVRVLSIEFVIFAPNDNESISLSSLGIPR